MKDFLMSLLERYYPLYFFALWQAVELKTVSQALQFFKAPVLDIGCEDGLITKMLVGNSYIGVDINFNAINEAKQNEVYRYVTIASARQLPFQNEIFNTIWSNCAIEHFECVEDVLSDFNRVLRARGYLIFTTLSERREDYFFFKNISMNLHMKR